MHIEQAIEEILRIPQSQLEVFTDDEDGWTYATLTSRETLNTITWNYGATVQMALDNLARSVSRLQPEDMR